MSGKLSSSPQEKLFSEFLSINGKEKREIKESITEVDKVCDFIVGHYSGAHRNNAFEILQKLAVEAHSFVHFKQSIRPALNNAVGSEAQSARLKATELFFNFFANTKSIEESFASYMVGRYRLGYPYLALYWAAVLFEQIITNKWRLQNKRWYSKSFDPDQEIKLNTKIAQLTDDTLRKDSVFLKTDIFQKYIFKYPDGSFDPPMEMSDQLDEQRIFDTRMRLTNFRILRNRIMHELNPEMKEEMSNNHLEFITYVWLELLPKSFEKQREKYPDTPPRETITTIFNTSADYMIRAVDETTKIEVIVDHYTAIQYSDFENLYKLRDILLPLRERLDSWLNEHSIDLLTDILTPIDTTSAYIWMPMVSRKKKLGKQNGVYNAAVSILVTPLDFRIYLDFGGYAQADRFSYYQFLESPEYRAFMGSFEGKEEMQVFDIDWYCFLTNPPVPLTVWNCERSAVIEPAKNKLIGAEIPITWNRMLHGYTIGKKALPAAGIEFDWIEQRLKWIIEFYQAYKAFQPPMTFETYKETIKG